MQILIFYLHYLAQEVSDGDNCIMVQILFYCCKPKTFDQIEAKLLSGLSIKRCFYGG